MAAAGEGEKKAPDLEKGEDTMAIKDLIPRMNRGRDSMPMRHGAHDPFHEFQRDMNRLFDDFFADFPLARHGGPEREPGLAAVFSPRVDVTETDQEVKVSAELPGMDEKDITVAMEDEALTLRGERKDEREEKGKNWYRREQSYGTFNRIIPLPAGVEGSKAKATFKKGILTVTVPKRAGEQARRKAIPIETD